MLCCVVLYDMIRAKDGYIATAPMRRRGSLVIWGRTSSISVETDIRTSSFTATDSNSICCILDLAVDWMLRRDILLLHISTIIDTDYRQHFICCYSTERLICVSADRMSDRTSEI